MATDGRYVSTTYRTAVGNLAVRLTGQTIEVRGTAVGIPRPAPGHTIDPCDLILSARRPIGNDGQQTALLLCDLRDGRIEPRGTLMAGEWELTARAPGCEPLVIGPLAPRDGVIQLGECRSPGGGSPSGVAASARGGNEGGPGPPMFLAAPA